MAVAASRLVGSSGPLQFGPVSHSSSSFSLPSGRVEMMMMMMKKKKKKVLAVVAKSNSSCSENVVLERDINFKKGGVLRDLGSVASGVAGAALGVLFKPWVKRKKSWQLDTETIVETGIINCRFFTVFAVAGTLIGSILCFVEGCFLVLEAFYQYFLAMSQRSDQQGAEVMQLLIEALDLFLVGNAMLTFGLGIYVMFVGSKEIMKRNKGSLIPGSNLFGSFHLKGLPSWLDMHSLSQAKSRIGHSVVMILQAGVIDKLKGVPMVSTLDLACFAGTILLFSACIFLLSRLSINNSTN